MENFLFDFPSMEGKADLFFFLLRSYERESGQCHDGDVSQLVRTEAIIVTSDFSKILYENHKIRLKHSLLDHKSFLFQFQRANFF